MKKFAFILMVSILVLVLTACNGLFTGGDNVYTTLNEMLDDDFSIISLDVETTMDGVTLKNNYTASIATNTTTVAYTVQKLNKIGLDFTANAPMIATTSGSADVVDGKLHIEGEDEISVEAITSPSIEFSKSFFTGATVVENKDGSSSFSATVTDIGSFTGYANFDGKDMSVFVSYTDSIESIVINYTMNNGATVKVTYTFQ